MSEHVDFKKCKYTKGSILGMECLICEGDRIKTAPVGYIVFYIREDENGNPYAIETVEPVVNYWGHILVKQYPNGQYIKNLIITQHVEKLAQHVDIHDSIDFGDGVEYQFQEVRVGDHPPYETEIVLREIDNMPEGSFEIYFEDLTPEAQKRYLEFMKVKSAKDLNMDMPGVFPITIIEY
nr:MAG TPA: Large polyvalent protein associated domain 28 [Caudoviricetes sp.]